MLKVMFQLAMCKAGNPDRRLSGGLCRSEKQCARPGRTFLPSVRGPREERAGQTGSRAVSHGLVLTFEASGSKGRVDCGGRPPSDFSPGVLSPQ